MEEPGLQNELITIQQFGEIELRAAKILEATHIEGADRLLQLKVDIGNGERQLVAGIKKNYAPEDLVGKSIIVVTNLKPARLRGVESQGMLLAAQTEAGPILATFDSEVAPGSIIK